MATYKNVTGALLVVTDEFNIRRTFDAGATISGLSTYLDRYTDAVVSGDDILLKRVGNKDNTYSYLPAPVIEEENMAVRPSAPNELTQGLVWGTPGGVRTADLTMGFTDPTSNTATRLRRIGFNTELDTRGRQVDTRYLDVKPAAILAVNGSKVFTGATLDQGGGAVRALTLTTVPAEYNGRRATAADVANSIYGSLVVLDEYYTAFGTLTYHDDSAAVSTTTGFVISGTTVTLVDNTFGGACTSLTATFVCATGVITFTRTGGQGADTIAATVYYAKACTTAATTNALYDKADEIRGWYEVSASTSLAGILLLTDYGVYQFLAAGNAIEAWS